MQCQKCGQQIHKLHDCILNPTADLDSVTKGFEPITVRMLAVAAQREIESHFDCTGGDLAAALDSVEAIIEICRTAERGEG